MTKIRTMGLILGILIICKGNQTMAQESTEQQQRFAQFSFVYPIGSNGINSPSFSNKFSLNALVGVNGGVSGVEIGGLTNFNRGDVFGIQLAGIGNFNFGKTTGLMLAGIANISSDETKAIQLSGIYNASTNTSSGVQVALINTTHGDYKGLQAGVINYAKKMHGVQMGVVNVIEDGDNAIPIGLLNIVKNGYYALEHTSNETMPLNLSFKMGVENFYTILRISGSTYLKEVVYGAGIGVGSNIPLSERSRIVIDLTTNNLEYSNLPVWKGINSLNKFELMYKFNLSEHFSVMAGPSYNAYVSNIELGDDYGTLNPPLVLSTDFRSDRQIQTWLGFSAGISITL